MDDPTPQHYNKTFRGAKLDPYRIDRVYGNLEAPLFQAVKKLLRAGEKPGESKRKAVIGAIDALQRWLEMEDEDREVI